MVKKSIGLCIALCLSLTLIFPFGGIANASEALSPDTTVTQENVNQVIEYLGLDPNNLDKESAIYLEDFPAVTVGELEQALKQLKQTPKEVTSTEDPPETASSSE